MNRQHRKESGAPRVVVVGSINLDYVTRVESLPGPGETVPADRFSRFRGGKGANQAIAAARQGCRVEFFGAVGNDGEGQSYLAALAEEGIGTGAIRTVRGDTGSAFITVDRHAENTIVIASGANSDLQRSDIVKGAEVIQSSAALLCQFEVPLNTVVEAAQIANRAGVPVVINPSPLLPTFPWEEVRTDFLVTNEHEAAELFGFPAEPHLIDDIIDRMEELRVANLIVTRGGEDTFFFSAEGSRLVIPVLPVLPVDTVGAGDAFAGCFTARIAQGEDLVDALRAANCAGALTTLGAGAQDPIPDRSQVDRHVQFLEN